MSNEGTVSIALAGDMFIAKKLPRPGEPGAEPVRALFERMAGADVTFINLESPYSERGYPAEKYTYLRSHPSLIDELDEMGVDVVTLANNHMLDYGYDALFDTLSLLDAKGIRRVGAGRNLQEAYAPAIIQKVGIRVAFLGFASTLPLGCSAGEERPGLAPIHIFSAFVLEPSPRTQEQPGTPPPVKTFPLQADITRMQKVVAATKREADIVIIAGHWGLASRLRPGGIPDVCRSRARGRGRGCGSGASLPHASGCRNLQRKADPLRGRKFHLPRTARCRKLRNCPTAA